MPHHSMYSGWPYGPPGGYGSYSLGASHHRGPGYNTGGSGFNPFNPANYWGRLASPGTDLFTTTGLPTYTLAGVPPSANPWQAPTPPGPVTLYKGKTQGYMKGVPASRPPTPAYNDEKQFPWLNHSEFLGWSGDQWKTAGKIGAGVLGGIGTIGGLLGAFGSTKGYDKPMSMAMDEYKKYSDPNSEWYRNAYQRYQRLFADSSPTMESLTGLARTGGVSATSASALAARQAAAIAPRNREAATNAMSDLYMRGSGLAQNALGMYNQLAAAKAEGQGSFWENVAGTGMGLLGLLV